MNKTKIATQTHKLIKILLAENKSPDEIYNIIPCSLGYTEDYLNRVFVYNYGITVRNFLKVFKIIKAYEVWIQNGGKKINSKSKVNHVKNFSLKFDRCFGFSPEFARDNNIDLMKNFIEFFDNIDRHNWYVEFYIS